MEATENVGPDAPQEMKVVEHRLAASAVDAIKVTRAQATVELAQNRLSEVLGEVAQPLLVQAEKDKVALQFKHFDFDTAELVFVKQVAIEEDTPEEDTPEGDTSEEN